MTKYPTMKAGDTTIRVLFVDDDTDESYLFNEALEHSELPIFLSRAIDGNHLLAKLTSEPLPDVIFMDINMPYKDGIEALTEIRANNQFSNLPVVIYSTATNSKYIDICYDRGASLYVVKPNDFDGMVDVVNKVCTMNWKDFTRPKRENFTLTFNS